MAVYLARNCPMCGNYFGVVIAKPNSSGYRPIHGRCATCSYEIAWALGRSLAPDFHSLKRDDQQNRFSGKGPEGLALDSQPTT